MKKSDAITLFGTVADLAKAMGMTRQGIYQWPDELPLATEDRVIGAAIRLGKMQPALVPTPPEANSNPERQAA